MSTTLSDLLEQLLQNETSEDEIMHDQVPQNELARLHKIDKFRDDQEKIN